MTSNRRDIHFPLVLFLFILILPSFALLPLFSTGSFPPSPPPIDYIRSSTRKDSSHRSARVTRCTRTSTPRGIVLTAYYISFRMECIDRPYRYQFTWIRSCDSLYSHVDTTR
ncbi:hypothetical protein PRIPAC_78532, partial [Pristionchus pacificus]|uniref:Uncharacterized protein n=1 Tax=Pristionchus pacificus TaxID=54126 RepID=A0A2A6C2V4_PRIPA